MNGKNKKNDTLSAARRGLYLLIDVLLFIGELMWSLLQVEQRGPMTENFGGKESYLDSKLPSDRLFCF